MMTPATLNRNALPISAKVCGLGLLVFAALCGLSRTASAAEGEAETAAPAISVSGSLTLVNDYVWRGQSQTWGKPALQLSLEAAHRSGFYAGFWTSNVSDQWVPGTHLETDWYAGYRDKLGGALTGFSYDLNALYVYYPGGNFDRSGFNLPSSRTNALEVYAALNYAWLQLKTGRVMTRFYGWEPANAAPGNFVGDPQAGIDGSSRGSWFIETNVNYEFTPGWFLTGQVGRETISHSQRINWNYYKAGISHTMGSWTAAAAWSDSSEPDAFKDFLGMTNDGDSYDAMRSRLLLSIGRSF